MGFNVGLLKSNLITLAGGASAPPVDPTLALDLEFSSMTALPASITFTRNTTATYFDQNGVLQTALANAARFDHNPTTLEPLGLLIEPARTNVLLGSEVIIAQDVTVTAGSYTLSFYGTGSVALSGVYTRNLVGVGVFPARTNLTFAVTAGTLTLTPTGTVTKAQLEKVEVAGGVNNPTSYIPTTVAAVPRVIEVATMTGVNFSSWFSASGTFISDIIWDAFAQNQNFAWNIGNGSFSAERLAGYVSVDGTLGIYISSGGAGQTTPNFPPGKVIIGVPKVMGISFAPGGNCSAAADGVAGTTITPYVAPLTINKLNILCVGNAAAVSSAHIRSLKFYNVAKTMAELIELTTP